MGLCLGGVVGCRSSNVCSLPIGKAGQWVYDPQIQAHKKGTKSLL